MRRRVAALVLVSAGLATAAAVPRGGPPEAPAGVTTVLAAAVRPQPEILTDEPHRATKGSASVYVPRELVLAEGRFDVLVHFHGAAKNQETNVAQAGLGAVVVSVNEGTGTTPYSRAFSREEALERVLELAQREVRTRPGAEKAAVGRVALSAWSAGGGAIRAILAGEEAERVDAVLIADGIFSRYEDPEAKTVSQEPLEPLAAFARRALAGEALFVLTHTAIETHGYPDVVKCTDALLAMLDLDKGPPVAEAPDAGGAPTYAAVRRGFRVLGYDGKGKQDHIDQIRALDDAYAALAERWGH
jgi:hypothetical protein